MAPEAVLASERQMQLADFVSNALVAYWLRDLELLVAASALAVPPAKLLLFCIEMG